MLTKEQYAVERAICTKAAGYAKQIMLVGKRNYITAEEAAHPDYAGCDNAMRGRVEQYEILTNPPETIYAYLSVIDGRLCASTWAGDRLGSATEGSRWRVHGAHWGSHMAQYGATIAGRYHRRARVHRAWAWRWQGHRAPRDCGEQA